MRTLGAPELIVVVMLVAIIVITTKAKPIGVMPYRWGAYLGFCSCMATLALPGQLILSKTVLGYGPVAPVVILTPVFLVAGIGLFLRSRVGVIAFYGAVAVQGLFAFGEGPEAFGQALLPIIVAAASYTYFRKRWPLMSKGLLSAKAKKAQAAPLNS
jgi:hypothetical protein